MSSAPAGLVTVYRGSDGNATRALCTRLEQRGPPPRRPHAGACRQEGSRRQLRQQRVAGIPVVRCRLALTSHSAAQDGEKMRERFRVGPIGKAWPSVLGLAQGLFAGCVVAGLEALQCLDQVTAFVTRGYAPSQVNSATSRSIFIASLWRSLASGVMIKGTVLLPARSVQRPDVGEPFAEPRGRESERPQRPRHLPSGIDFPSDGFVQELELQCGLHVRANGRRIKKVRAIVKRYPYLQEGRNNELELTSITAAS